MLFNFGPRSSLLLPFVVPGAVATLWLLGRAARRGAASDALFTASSRWACKLIMRRLAALCASMLLCYPPKSWPPRQRWSNHLAQKLSRFP